jgi:hypothetical protein
MFHHEEARPRNLLRGADYYCTPPGTNKKCIRYNKKWLFKAIKNKTENPSSPYPRALY